MFNAMIISCEHGGNKVPKAYADRFAGQLEILRSHRGWDPGALDAARFMAGYLDSPLFHGETTRLLVELNRSLRAPDLFSEFTRELPEESKNDVLETIYKPYWEKIEHYIRHCIDNGKRVVHLSIHSFTPELNGEVRDADIGLLYDPEKELELKAAAELRTLLEEYLINLRIRDNYPYLGTADGLTTELRSRFPEGSYAGIEIEINQKIPLENGPLWASVKEGLAVAAKGLMDKEN